MNGNGNESHLHGGLVWIWIFHRHHLPDEYTERPHYNESLSMETFHLTVTLGGVLSQFDGCHTSTIASHPFISPSGAIHRTGPTEVAVTWAGPSDSSCSLDSPKSATLASPWWVRRIYKCEIHRCFCLTFRMAKSLCMILSKCRWSIPWAGMMSREVNDV